jgi:beta-1,2-mannobiose phosphorylase / 1,2-beta-oligomannan phosphorylase
MYFIDTRKYQRIQSMNVLRSEKNPIISPEDVLPSRPGFKVVSVFNCGVIRFKGETLLLMRVAESPISNNPQMVLAPMFDEKTGKLILREFNKEDPSIDLSDPRVIKKSAMYYLTSISHFRIARSRNGIDFEIEKKPAMFPENKYERFGIEDPRITRIGEKYYISYAAISDLTGITVCLASTTDFIKFLRHGVIFMPDNKDVSIFPEKINGRYYALSRPISGEFGKRDMWISESDDLICWGNHTILMETRKKSWDTGRIGCGAVPFRIEAGWLEIYHGSSIENRYCLGAVLLDADNPRRIVARSEKPIISPEADYEQKGFFGDVIFTCGVLFEEHSVKIYYGAADTCIAYAEMSLADILDQLKF